jgi:hypothetical protein
VTAAALDGTTILVGAGVSIPSGAPDFLALRNIFLRPILREDVREIAMDDLSPEQIFDALDDGLLATRREIRRVLWEACEPNEPNRNHYALARLGAAGAQIWTTNFDTMIERAATRLHITWETKLPDGVSSPARGAALTINKLHGSFPYTGDPPQAPPSHDYPLLFRRRELWNPLGATLTRSLDAALEGRRVHLFGYRGTDLDLMPILLRALPRAEGVEWWELDRNESNLSRLRGLFVGLPSVRINRGNPSCALQQLAAEHKFPLPSDPPNARPPRPSYGAPVTSRVRANVIGRFRGSPAARRALLRSVLADPVPLRRGSARRLIRSLGFDVPEIGVILLVMLPLTLRLPRLRRELAIWETYAAVLDALPLRRRDPADLRRLEQSPYRDAAELLTRLASKRKRIGQLAQAARDGERALAGLHARREPSPALEAMTAYNLIWIYRQLWKLPRRQEIYEQYEERLAHVGFNWAGWLTLDEALLNIALGHISRSRELLDSPRMRYVRRIGHPAFLIDQTLGGVLVDWAESGPMAIMGRLEETRGRFKSRRILQRRAYSRVNTLLLLADHARATGDERRMSYWLSEARRSTRSALQHHQAELLEATARGDEQGLCTLAEHPEYGLIAASAKAVLGHEAPGRGLSWRPLMPLPALL